MKYHSHDIICQVISYSPFYVFCWLFYHYLLMYWKLLSAYITWRMCLFTRQGNQLKSNLVQQRCCLYCNTVFQIFLPMSIIFSSGPISYTKAKAIFMMKYLVHGLHSSYLLCYCYFSCTFLFLLFQELTSIIMYCCCVAQ